MSPQPDPPLDRSTVGQERDLRHLPPQIRRQVNSAYQREADQRTAAAPPADANQAPPASAAPAAPAAAPPPPAGFVGPRDNDPMYWKSLFEESVNPAHPLPAGDPREHDPRYWKARYVSAEGITKKQATEIRELREQVAAAKAAAIPPPAAPATPAPIKAEELAQFYTPEQITEFGAEYLVANHTALQAATAKLVDSKLKPVLDDAAERRRLDAEEEKRRKAENVQKFLDAVDAAAPGWREINKDPRWLAWLDKEGADGIVRQSKLDTYSGRGDATRVAAMFNEFVQSLGAAPPPPPPAPLLENAGGGASGAGQQPTPVSGPYPFTAQGYKQWKSLLARSPGNLYQGNADLTKRISAQYDTAIASGTLPGLAR